MKKKILSALPTYIIAIAIPLGVGALSALLTYGNMDIYKEIVTPPLAPPSWLFPVAWTVLYILMGVSSGMIFGRRKDAPEAAGCGLKLYAASLFVNFFWSIIFFNLGAFLFAFIWLLLLIYLVVRSTLCYGKVKPVAAYLQIPYIVWLLFAAYLNGAIFILN